MRRLRRRRDHRRRRPFSESDSLLHQPRLSGGRYTGDGSYAVIYGYDAYNISCLWYPGTEQATQTRWA